MTNIQKVMIEKDRKFRIAENRVTKSEYFAVTNPLGYIRQVTKTREVMLGNTTFGVIANYDDEVDTTYSYISIWDGREGISISADIGPGCYYIKWMDCFALELLRDRNVSEHDKEYLFIPVQKSQAWLTKAIQLFNRNTSSPEKIRFKSDFGAYLLTEDGEEKAISEIKLSKTRLDIHCGLVVYKKQITDIDRSLSNLPSSGKVKYNIKEVVAN